DAIRKAFDDAKKNLVTVKMTKNTIAHDINYKSRSAKIILKPAVEGRGIIAGGAVRVVVEFSGIKDIVSKSLGTANKLSVARAAVEALATLNQARTRKERVAAVTQ
ncbi:MAG: 30S ribosomal protein S5, partial [bacterium]|nr:30S ribosomal protein S5 [bacterium]